MKMRMYKRVKSISTFAVKQKLTFEVSPSATNGLWMMCINLNGNPAATDDTAIVWVPFSSTSAKGYAFYGCDRYDDIWASMRCAGISIKYLTKRKNDITISETSAVLPTNYIAPGNISEEPFYYVWDYDGIEYAYDTPDWTSYEYPLSLTNGVGTKPTKNNWKLYRKSTYYGIKSKIPSANLIDATSTSVSTVQTNIGGQWHGVNHSIVKTSAKQGTHLMVCAPDCEFNGVHTIPIGRMIITVYMVYKDRINYTPPP